MARNIQSRLLIEGTMVALTPLHVGGLGESPDTDLPLARNGAGNFSIPGTGICGVLRSWCNKRVTDKDLIAQLFGPESAGGHNNGQASYVIIEDAALPEETQSEIRDSVGIDRIRGAAADEAKFDRAILPKGTEFTLRMIVEMPNDSAAKTKTVFGLLLEALQNGEIRFGASRTRGLGHVRLKEGTQFTVKEQHLDQSKGILEILRGGGTPLTPKDLKNAAPGIRLNDDQCLRLAITWEPASPLMVKASYEGIAADMLPLTSGNGAGKVSLCLPGASIKGALRAQAGRIARTVTDSPAPEEFHEQLKFDLINELFGGKKERDSANNRLGLGAVSVDDCYMDKTIPIGAWQTVESAKADDQNSPLLQALKTIDPGEKDFSIAHHVAIDRWTGGASEGALFTVLQPAPGMKWNDIVLDVDLERLGGKKHQALMLLLLTLRDLAQNRVPLGFAVNRGMGEIVIKGIKINGPFNIVWKNTTFEITDAKASDIQKEWETWIRDHQATKN